VKDVIIRTKHGTRTLRFLAWKNNRRAMYCLESKTRPVVVSLEPACPFDGVFVTEPFSECAPVKIEPYPHDASAIPPGKVNAPERLCSIAHVSIRRHTPISLQAYTTGPSCARAATGGHTNSGRFTMGRDIQKPRVLRM